MCYSFVNLEMEKSLREAQKVQEFLEVVKQITATGVEIRDKIQQTSTWMMVYCH